MTGVYIIDNRPDLSRVLVLLIPINYILIKKSDHSVLKKSFDHFY